MKYILVLLTMFSFLQTSQATDCAASVLVSYKAMLDAGDFRLDDLLTVSTRDAVLKIKSSEEIEDEDAALKAVRSSKNTLFLGYSSQGGGSAEEILVVNKSTCKIIHRFYTFVE
jgi:hypothetical protein